jgi:hypothetical protein
MLNQNKAIFIGLMGSAGFFVPAVYADIAHKNDETILKDTLTMGTCPTTAATNCVDRPAVQNDLVRILTPQDDPDAYYTIVGEKGCGKSTLIRQVRSTVGSGVIYIELPSDVEEFGKAFAAAIGFNFRPSQNWSEFTHGIVYGQKPEQHQGTILCFLYRSLTERWKLPYEKFKELARWYRAKYGKCPVLVIDNCNILANDAEEILKFIQLDAKTAVDHREYVVVFVCSDGVAPDQLKGEWFYE